MSNLKWAEPHTVDLDELLAWIADDDTFQLYASSSRERKQLLVRMRGGYIVTSNGKAVYDGTDGRSAVNAYNSLTEIPARLALSKARGETQ